MLGIVGQKIRPRRSTAMSMTRPKASCSPCCEPKANTFSSTRLPAEAGRPVVETGRILRHCMPRDGRDAQGGQPRAGLESRALTMVEFGSVGAAVRYPGRAS